MGLRDDSIIFLLGAGASVDAGLKHAKQMTEDIETKVLNNGELSKYRDLYYFLKSSIIYQKGLSGHFDNDGTNIEDLMNVLSELNLKHQNTLYPFIGSWNVHLSKVSGKDFENAEELEKQIRKQLFNWINVRSYDEAQYFSNFEKFADELGSPIRIFTLNYDLCVERAVNPENIELGFDEKRNWEWSRFEPNENVNTKIYLYKLHGSIDWQRDEKNSHLLTKCDSPQEKSDLIFGTTAKLSSRDPYLFYVHEFRKYSLQEPLRLIVTIGYSFSDEYLNSLIRQAILSNDNAVVLSVSPIAKEKVDIERARIAAKVGVDVGKIVVQNFTAKEFLSNKLSLENLSKIITNESDTPF